MHRGLILLAAATCGRAASDPAEVLARMGHVITRNASRLPDYTCVETIERRYYRAKLAGSPRNCDDLSAEKKKRGYRLSLEVSDRIRLEVTADSLAERFSWPGADRVDDRDLERIIGYGPAATGAFGTLLLSLFQGDATDFAFQGEAESAGRKLFVYSFRVPEIRSHFQIRSPDGRSIVAEYDGTIFADPDTAQPVRLTTRTAELPAAVFCCEINSSFEYGSVRTAMGELLIPREARQRFIERSGVETETIATFSGCGEFTAGPKVTRKAAAPLDIPAGVPVTIALATRVDSATAAAGDRFTGALARPVLYSGKILLKEGAAVSGRITKVETRMRPASVIIGLSVETVQIDGAAVPIHLIGKAPESRLHKALSSLHIGGSVFSTGSTTVAPVPAQGETLCSELSFPGAHQVLDRGYLTEWLTVKP